MACVVLAVLGFAGAATAQYAPLAASSAIAVKLSPDLARAFDRRSPDRRVSVIVTTNGKRAASVLAASPVPQWSATARAAYTPLGSASVFQASVSRDELAALLSSPDVRHVSPDRPLRACQDFATQTVGASVLTSYFGITGSGVTVAVLDTGIAAHEDLGDRGSRIAGWVDLVNGKARPYDDNGHGTHVAGIVAGDGTASENGRYSASLTWMAPCARLVGVKVLDSSGSGSVSTVIAGINWCIDHRRQYNIRILNLSLGHPVAESFRTDPLCQACERAWSAGMVVVCAAGNMGRVVADDPASGPAYGTIVCPGNDPMVITVGATNTLGTATLADDKMATYSSRGPSAIDFVLKPDLVAPGNQIDSLAAQGSELYRSYPASRIDPAAYSGTGPVRYFRMSGTSMACPVVAGAAAMLLQVDPSLSPDTIKARLMVSATKSSVNDPASFGAGCLNVPRALLSRIGAPRGAYSPTAYPVNDGTVQICPAVTGDNLIWGNNLIWGDNKAAANVIYGSASWDGGGIAASGLWTGTTATAAGCSPLLLEMIMINGD